MTKKRGLVAFSDRSVANQKCFCYEAGLRELVSRLNTIRTQDILAMVKSDECGVGVVSSL